MFTQIQKSLGEYGIERSTPLDWRYSDFISFVVLVRNTDPKDVSARMDKYKEFLENENKDNMIQITAGD